MRRFTEIVGRNFKGRVWRESVCVRECLRREVDSPLKREYEKTCGMHFGTLMQTINEIGTCEQQFYALFPRGTGFL